MGKGRSKNAKDRSHYILIFVAMALLAIWTTAAVAGISQRQTEITQTKDELLRLNQLVSEQTGSLFRELKGQLQILDNWLTDNPDKDPRTEPDFTDLLLLLRSNGRFPINIRLISNTGGLYSLPFSEPGQPRIFVSDREYFKAQQNPDTQGFFIGEPVLSRVNGLWGIPVSYPIQSKNSGMLLLSAVIELPQLNELYEAVRPKPSGAITLARTDGTLLNRVPFDAKLMGTTFSRTSESYDYTNGVGEFTSPIDSDDKIIAFQLLDDLSLALSVSISKKDILAAWTDRMVVWLTVLAVVTIILSALGLFLWRSWRHNIHNETRMHRLNEELASANEMARLVTENSTDVFAVLSLPDMVTEYVSSSLERNWGWKETDLIGKTLENLLDAESAAKARDKILTMLSQLRDGDKSGFHGKIDIDIPHKDGHKIPHELASTIICDESGFPDKIVVFAHDLTERKANEEIVRNMAFYDRLTGLANRRLLEDRLAQLLPLTLRDEKKLAILFIDLDRFKPINDTYGHEAGDWLLRQAADRMRSCLRQSDTIARTGGDEFVAVLPDVGTPESAMGIAEKIRQRLSEGYPYGDGKAFSISASLGVVLYPDHGKDARDLLMLSDTAMYQAKKSGRNRVIMCASDSAVLSGSNLTVSFMPWQESYKCGNEDIDKEHRELFRMVNELLKLASQAIPDHQKCADAITHLETHIHEHFLTEESILSSLGYPDALMHKILHGELVRKLRDIKRRYESEESTIGELVDFIAKVVVDEHLLNEDRKYYDVIGAN